MDGEQGEQDLALLERQKAKFEKLVWNTINEVKDNGEGIIVINNVECTITFKPKEGYSISFAGNKLLSVNEKGEFSYPVQSLKALKAKNDPNKLDEPDIIDKIGLPDLNYLDYIEKEKKKENEKTGQKEEKTEKGKEENNQNEQDDKDGKDDKDEQEEDVKTKGGRAEIREVYGKSVTIDEIGLHRNKVAGGFTLAQTLGLEDCSKLYAVKSGESWNLVVQKAETQEIIPVGHRISSPTYMQGTEIEDSNNTLRTVKFTTEFEINGMRIAIQDGYAQEGPYTQFLLGRPTLNKGINDEERGTYTQLDQPSKGLDMTQQNPKERERIGKEYTSNSEHMANMENYEVLGEIRKSSDINITGTELESTELNELSDEKALEIIESVLRNNVNIESDFPGQQKSNEEKIPELAKKILDGQINMDSAIEELGGKSPREDEREDSEEYVPSRRH